MSISTSWGTSSSFPRAILHIDGDAFFASCEVAKNPTLRGKAVITGKERGIVSACTYEAKAMGVKRGMRLFEVKKLCPEAIILPSDYETYSLFSQRMYEIVRRYTPTVEEYSIDECFADLTGLRRMHRASYIDIAKRIKHDLDLELGMTFSIGLSSSKVLAKIGSKWQKPSGMTPIPLREAHLFLSKTDIGSVWGIGPNTAAYLRKFGITTAQDFVEKDETWVTHSLNKPYQEIWHELRGTVINELDTEGKKTYHSISKTKTFTPPSSDPLFIMSQLSKNIENACIKLRRWKLVTPRISFFIKTQAFTYHGFEIILPHPTAIPQDIIKEVETYFPQVFKNKTLYRASGVTMMHLEKDTAVQLDMFGKVEKSEAIKKVFESVDSLSAKYGKHALFLGSSFKAMTHSAHDGARGDTPSRQSDLFKGETGRRRLNIPMLGSVG